MNAGDADGHDTRLIVSLTDATEPLARQIARAADDGATLVELRVDWLGDSEAVRGTVRTSRLPTIVTVRRRDEGGRWTESEAARKRLLLELAALGPALVDVEAATLDADAAFGRAVRERAPLLVSHHDLVETPADLEAVGERVMRHDAAVWKLVWRAADARDALRVLAWLGRQREPSRVVALAMGDAGLATRVLAKRMGAFGTYCAPAAGEAAAEGQVTAAVLRRRYRWDAIGRATRVYGVAGWPVGHSKSPAVHNAAFAERGEDAVYVPLAVADEAGAFVGFMDLADAGGLWGLSVTIPHKVAALDWLRARGGSPGVHGAAAGAVNTLWRSAAGTWDGENTDVMGLMDILASLDMRGVGSRAVVLGAGGVARAAAVALRSAGFAVTVCNRTLARAEALAGEFGCAVAGWERREGLSGAVLVNATSVGMAPAVEATPLAGGALGAYGAVVETVYTPARTRLLAEAAEAGCVTVGGGALFIGQAVRQFEAWCGGKAPRGVMESALVTDV